MCQGKKLLTTLVGIEFLDHIKRKKYKIVWY